MINEEGVSIRNPFFIYNFPEIENSYLFTHGDRLMTLFNSSLFIFHSSFLTRILALPVGSRFHEYLQFQYWNLLSGIYAI